MADHIVVNVGEKLLVGKIDTSFLTAGSKLTPGTCVLNGPVFIGSTPQIGIARASCMIGPPLGISAPASLEVTGVTNIIGSFNVIAVSTFEGLTTKLGATIKKALSLKLGVGASLSLSTKSTDQVTSGKKVCNGGITTPRIDAAYGQFITCKATLGIFSQVAAPFKLFDIPHPTKSRKRLRHSCLEGPEIGVYYRGRLVNSNIIELPEYWRKLVDAETITVNLTPHSFHQDLYVKSIEWGTRINVLNNSGSAVDCSYVVYAERKDVEKLIVEYEEDPNKKYPEEV